MTTTDYDFIRYSEGRLSGLRSTRYSWWAHARELADYLLPRRYRWLISPNQMSRGSPINQHILDSTGTLSARNCASGMMSGISSPTRPWFKLKVGRIDSTQTSPASLWLAEVERLMMLVFQQSNFYNAIAVVYFDLVIFGTAVILIYEDFEDVIRCFNPCYGEYYIDVDGKLRPVIFYREFTYTIAQVVDEFGLENCSIEVQNTYNLPTGTGRSKEIVVAHAVEPNDGKYGIPKSFPFREVYWEYGNSQGQQGGTRNTKCLRKKGYHDQFVIPVRWDLAGNDAYGRGPGHDALPDVKQLQLETRRKAQAIDKLVNPPMVADIQLKNQPASLLPGGVTYISGMTSQGRVGFAPAYTVNPPVGEIKEDLEEIRQRIQKTFFNDLFRTASQYETRSGVTAVEWDMRKAESLMMLGPVLERIEDELLARVIDRTFSIMSRSGVLPPPPPEIAGANINIEYVSMLATAQAAAATGGIERLLSLAGNLVAVDPAVMDNIDVDFALDKYSSLMNNDPRLIRSPDQLAEIRANRQAQQAQQQKIDAAEKMAKSAKVLSETPTESGQSALTRMTGI